MINSRQNWPSYAVSDRNTPASMQTVNVNSRTPCNNEVLVSPPAVTPMAERNTPAPLQTANAISGDPL